MDGDSAYGNATEFYTQLFAWYRLGGGVRYRNNIQWKDESCNVEGDWDTCAPTVGINATRIGFTLSKEYTSFGQDRYDTMVALREQINVLFPASPGGEQSAFPFTVQFLYWEEVGVIDVELWRNLGICGGVILGVIFLLIPNPRVAPIVIFTTISAIVEVVGFLHFWDVTISGVSTIYLLICVGLAVDYSAHIGHVFTLSSGTSKERTIEAISRIGPSTFNAVVSTLVACVVLAASQSYVFRVFFKALFLVVMLGGANGLWLLPVLLSLLGGHKEGSGSKKLEGGTASEDSASMKKQESSSTGYMITNI